MDDGTLSNELPPICPTVSADVVVSVVVLLLVLVVSFLPRGVAVIGLDHP